MSFGRIYPLEEFQFWRERERNGFSPPGTTETMLLLSSPVASSPPVNPRRRRPPPSASLDAVRRLVDSTTARNAAGVSASSPGPEHPIQSLRRGDWVKLICGASFEVDKIVVEVGG